MRKFITALILIAVAVLLRAEDIKTTDGTVYQNATIVSSNPTGIDISYQKNDKTVLKGIRFEILPESIQKRYGYDPEASKKFDQDVTKYQRNDLDHNIASRKGSTKSYYMATDRRDLKAIVYAYRRSVTVSPIGGDDKGSVVMVNELLSGKPINADLIYIEGLKIKTGSWTGMIYPTAVKIRIDGFNFGMRVFSTNLTRSTEILAENMMPSSDDDEEESSPAIVGSNKPDDTTSVDVELTPYDNEPISIVTGSFGTYIGGVYYPKWRPRPPRPPKPRPKPKPKSSR